MGITSSRLVDGVTCLSSRDCCSAISDLSWLKADVRLFRLRVAEGRGIPHFRDDRCHARALIEGTQHMDPAPRESFWLRNTDWFLPGGILIVGLCVLFVIPFLKRIL
jgi:hypothetical protein